MYVWLRSTCAQCRHSQKGQQGHLICMKEEGESSSRQQGVGEWERASGSERESSGAALRLLPSAAYYAKLVPGFISAVYGYVRECGGGRGSAERLRVSLAALQVEQGT